MANSRTWTMPSETAPQTKVWMSFPAKGKTLGSTTTEEKAGYETWSAVAAAIADYEPVTMLVDPSSEEAARKYLRSDIETITAPVGEFWMRDTGPTFVTSNDGKLGAVNWTYNGWGAPDWANWEPDVETAAFVGKQAGAEVLDSSLVNEGGGIHTDGMGTLLLTETVQLDPRRNPNATKESVEVEMSRLLGVHHFIWLPRGLYRDTQEFGTNGHVDIVATIPSPGRLLLHSQTNPEHPDYALTQELRDLFSDARDAQGNTFEILEVPAPSIIRDDEDFVDYSYINHLVINGAVIACGFADPMADGQATEILQDAYPNRDIVMLDAREIFDRGGGIHCITQHQPAV